MRAFKYSGNKTKFPMLELPARTERIVEPFAGSMGFSLQRDLPALGIDTNAELIDMWKWLQTRPDLTNLNQYVGKRVDVRTLPLRAEEKTYLRINIASVCVGQLSSWTIYPQHKLPIGDTEMTFDKIESWEFVAGDYSEYKPIPGDFVFVDPPYLGQFGNYGENNLDLEKLINWLRGLDAPWLMTYSEPIPQLSESWVCWLEKKVPNMRSGGSKLRKDWYTKNF